MLGRAGSPKQNVTQASAWVTYLLLAIGMIGPVVCVVWLVRNAVENEKAVVRRLLAEADLNQLANAEKSLIEAIAAAASDEESGGVRVSWAANEVAVPLAQQREARVLLASVRQRLEAVDDARAQSIVAAMLQDGDGAGLYLGGGRAVEPMLLEMALRRAGDNGLESELLSVADRYVADFANSDSPIRQRRYLLRRYAPFTSSPEIRRLLQREVLVEGWKTELENDRRFPPGAGVGRTSEAFHYRSELKSEAVVFPLAQLRSIAAGVQEIEDSEIEVALSEPGSAAGDAFVARRMQGPLDFAWLVKPSGRSNADLSSDRALFYLWIGGIVLALSGVSSVAIVLSLRRQASVAELKDNLVATVTHELKTPVSSIRLLVDTLLDESKRDKVDAREYIELISRENQRLGRLIDNFLSFSRMERAKDSFEIRPISAAEVAETAAVAFRERFAGQAFELVVEFQEDVPRIAGDRDALATALGNLLENALKYGGPGRRIELSVRAAEQGAEFAVRDFGEGIARKDRKRIFSKFYQASHSQRDRSGGVGLGLSIVEFIVSRHSGKVELESELGKGSVFKVRIPYA